MTPAGTQRLKDDEGLRLKPYADTRGKTTIGYGRNLTDKGISAAEAGLLFVNDIADCERRLATYPWFAALDPVRADAVTNAAFNMGVDGLLGFHHMIAALSSGDYESAAAQLLDSDAARELPQRYGRLADAMRSGSWETVTETSQ